MFWLLTIFGFFLPLNVLAVSIAPLMLLSNQLPLAPVLRSVLNDSFIGRYHVPYGEKLNVWQGGDELKTAVITKADIKVMAPIEGENYRALCHFQY